jgi:hypothetical protein
MIDLNKLGEKFDHLFETETFESYNLWLKEKERRDYFETIYKYLTSNTYIHFSSHSPAVSDNFEKLLLDIQNTKFIQTGPGSYVQPDYNKYAIAA